MSVSIEKSRVHGAIKQKNEGWSENRTARFVNSLMPMLTLVMALFGLMVVFLAIGRNDLEAYPVPILAFLSLVLELLFLDVYRLHRRWDLKLVGGGVLAFLFLLALRSMPEYITGWQLNAVIHRSVFSILFLGIISMAALCWSIYYLAGATPQADDLSRYPLVLLPVFSVMALYLYLVYQLCLGGFKNISWAILTTPYFHYFQPVKYFIQGDWPAWTVQEFSSVGLENYILGTGMLILLTSLIALPIGMATGLYLNEYGDGWFGKLVRWVTTSLRAISVLILGLAAFNISLIPSTPPLAFWLHGIVIDNFSQIPSQGGSFLIACLILSLLVIPVIARMTEEGCRSLPVELREGSCALGASEERTIWRIVIPWALPNVITAWLISSAEVSGSVAVLMFIAGRGDFGAGVFNQVTSLAYLVYDIHFGDQAFRSVMQPYQYLAASILMLIVLLFGIGSVLSKTWLTRKFRGG